MGRGRPCRRAGPAHEARLPLALRSSTEFKLAHNITSKAEVVAVMELAKRAGAIVADPAYDAFWGGFTGLFQDPDGHFWEVAWYPDWKQES
jgi:uncharacterized glyoxalase superfamily protein PhnB